MDHKKSYRELFERSPNAILIMEGDRFVDCNPAAVQMLRFPNRQALLDRYYGTTRRGDEHAHPADLSPPRQADGRDSFEKAEENLAITFERGSHTFEWTHLCADGEPLLVEVQLTVVERGEKPVLHVVWRDISDRKRIEAELRRTQRLEAVGRLAGGIAHDFNNLLVVILGHAELLQQEFESGRPNPNHVAGIQSASERAAALTRQLLAFSRGQPALSQPTDLGDLVNHLGGLLRRLLGEHIQLELKRREGVLTTVADPSQLEQIVVNLAANARDAMPGGGDLVISVARRRVRPDELPGTLPAGNYVILKVHDSGSGMTHEQQERAFDPFYSTKAPGRGTGLGLATVHGIAEQNGGHVSIVSGVGLGTTVEVLLPLSDQEPVPLGKEPQPLPARGGRETILLVEDEQEIRDLFETALGAEGYRVLADKDGQQALDRVARCNEPIDLLITDVVMPRLSGPDLVRHLRRTLPELQVLYMSGYSDEGSLGIGSDGGRTLLLQKPFTPTELQRAARTLLDRSRAAASGCASE